LRFSNAFTATNKNHLKSVPTPIYEMKEPMSDLIQFETIINNAWQDLANINADTQGPVRDAVMSVILALDNGSLRVASPVTENETTNWVVNEWVKKAVLLFFRLHNISLMAHGPAQSMWWDKVPMKFDGWNETNFKEAGFRAVPGALVRRSAYIAPDVVLMPSFVNVGAHVGRGTMVDTWATIGSCAQIGAHCHISGGTGIGGVLEPLQAAPVIIEDNVFIGARSEVAEGVRVGKGSVISMGVFLGASTKIIDRQTGEIFQGYVPPYSVVVPGSLPGKPLADGSQGPSLSCAVIVKRVDEQTRSKTAINELLRD
jgi:2,3,4,5-tetrahydropyridine-2-carboxylate N-succinyltransferase